MSTPTNPPTKPRRLFSMAFMRTRVGLIASIAGLLIFLLGARPSLFGLDRSPIVGFVQITVFLVGLGVICLGGYITLVSLWAGKPRSILADFGARFVSSGFIMAAFSGMADVFGFGSQPLPDVPYFGPWQATGVVIGEAVIALGLLLLVPYQNRFKFISRKH